METGFVKDSFCSEFGRSLQRRLDTADSGELLTDE
jgi:hypothetical protein